MRRTLAAVGSRPISRTSLVLVSLYRPADGFDPLVARARRPRGDHYPHPLLETVLKDTYGIFVVQCR